MHNNYRWCEMVAYEKITTARKAAAHDRLAAVAVQAKCAQGQGAQPRQAGLLRTLVDLFGHGRPVLERKVPTGQA